MAAKATPTLASITSVLDQLARDPNAQGAAAYAPTPWAAPTSARPDLGAAASGATPPAGTASGKIGAPGGFWNDVKGAGGHVLQGALNAISVPAAMVTGGINELGQISEPGKDANGNPLPHGTSSFHDFLNEAFGHVADRVSVHDIRVGNAAKGIGVPQTGVEKWLATRKGPLGFALDTLGSVATDPLTYVRGPAEFAGIHNADAAARVGEVGDQEVAALKDAGDAAGAAEHAAQIGELTTRAARGGVSAMTPAERAVYLLGKDPNLSAEELAQAGKGGLKLNVPGTGRIGRTIANAIPGVDVGHEAVQVPLISERFTHPIQAVLDAISAKAGDVARGSKLGVLLGGRNVDQVLENTIRTAGDERALAAQTALTASRTAHQGIPATTEALRSLFKNATDGLGQTDKADLVRALGGDAAAEARVAEAAPKVRAAFDATLQQLQDAGRSVNRVSDYFPNVLTEDAKHALGIGQDGTYSSAKQFFEHARTLTDGASFLDGTVRGANPQEIRDSADKILQTFIDKNPKLSEELGNAKTTLFSNNFDKVVGTYTKGAARSIAVGKAAQRLADLGVGERAAEVPGPVREQLTQLLRGAHGDVANLVAKQDALAAAAPTAASLDAVPAAERNLTDTISQLVNAGKTANADALTPALKQSVRNMASALKDARSIGTGTSTDRLGGAIDDLMHLAGLDSNTVEHLVPDHPMLGSVHDRLLNPDPKYDALRRELTHAAQDNVQRVTAQHSLASDSVLRSAQDAAAAAGAPNAAVPRAQTFASDLQHLPSAPITDQVQFANTLRTDPQLAHVIAANSENTTAHVTNVLTQALGHAPNPNELAAGSKVVAAADQLDGARAIAQATPADRASVLEQARHEAAALHAALADPHLLTTSTSKLKASIEQAAANADARVAWGGVLSDATASGDKPLGYVASLQQVAAQTEQRMIDASQRALGYDHVLSNLSEPMTRQFTDTIKSEMGRGIKVQLADGVATPADAAEAITRMDSLQTPANMRGFFKRYDALVGYVKDGEIATPGFHFRVMFGHAWQNELAGMQFSSYRDFLSLVRRAGQDGASEEDRALLDLIQRSTGVTQSEAEFTRAGQLGTTFDEAQGASKGAASRFNPLSRNFELFAKSKDVGVKVQSFMRGSLAYDTLTREGAIDAIKNGADTSSLLDHAVQQVQKFHFDYQDLSNFERSTVKRIIPFYTFTRKNIPLQVEMMFRNPRVFARYQQFKTEIEAQSSPDKVVPSYFSNELQIRLPFMVNGGHLYSNGALPLTDIAGITDPGQLAGNVTPVIKAPIENFANKQFYEGIPFTGKYTPANPVFEAPGVAQALIASGHAKRGKNGQLFMTDKDQYLAEQFIPILGRVRRLAPADPKFQDKAIQSWITTAFGVSTRTNTRTQQLGQLEGQQITAANAKSKATKTQRQLGFKPPSAQSTATQQKLLAQLGS